MKVSVLSATPQPMDVVAIAAGTCCGKDNNSHARVRHCFESNHMSVFEHVSVTLKIEGISRACMAQLTRHRLCSYCVESQRYCKYDLKGDDWYIIPPEFDKRDASYFKKCMREAASHYNITIHGGMKPEDARYLLPEATKTNLVMSCNARELFHILDMRQDSAAQWEIRNLANEIELAIMEHNDQWSELLSLRKER